MHGDKLRNLVLDSRGYLSVLQPFLARPRETVPRLTAGETRRVMRWAAELLGLELIEVEGTAPTYLLLPPPGTPPAITLLGAWHSESSPVAPAAVEGSERLALAATLAALGAVGGTGAKGGGTDHPPVALVVVPATTHGSLVLRETLSNHRARLRAPAAFWPRISALAPARRRIFLGARGRAVLGLWGEAIDPYRIRDKVVAALKDEAYGPRPLDFELLRKLAQSGEALDFLEGTFDDPAAVEGEGEARFRNALFGPRALVLTPPVRHPDRPQAWLIFETAENMDAADICTRVKSLAPGARVDLAEALPWDRFNIHHPSVQALVPLAKSRSAGPEIWPMAPWTTPSGVFTRALGVPLAEWGVPLPQVEAIRNPGPEIFEPVQLEIAELLLRATGRFKPET